MTRTLNAVLFNGIHIDSLGHYLAGLGLLVATYQRWPSIRGCWRCGRFVLLSSELANLDDIKAFLLTDWKPTSYERWWSAVQKADTKAKSSTGIWRERNCRSMNEVRLLDAHIVGIGRNRFNPVLGTGGNVGKRDLAKAWKDAFKLLSKPGSPEWLDATLTGNVSASMPDLSSGGTWFVFANKTFNSGQSWFREGQLSPWSQLLAMEGALMLVGSVNRRLGSRARPYAVFPFISEPSQPETDGEIGMSRAEFWAPLWGHPATLPEVRSLFQRGLARLGGRPAQAPHEFAVAALGAGVDAGVDEFARYELRQTTSSQVYEAIPRDRIPVNPVESYGGTRHTPSGCSKLLVRLIESGWLDRLPYEPRDSKQKGKFVGLRGPIESAIVHISERHADAEDPERWQKLLLQIARVQGRVDRNKTLRERCLPVPLLSPDWFDKAWPFPTAEIEASRAIASIGWGFQGNDANLPVLANVFGVELGARAGRWTARLPKSRPAKAIWGPGDPLQVLLDLGHRRLVDADCASTMPFDGTQCCSLETMCRFLRNDSSLDFEQVFKWIPPLSLIAWNIDLNREQPLPRANTVSVVLDGTAMLHALVRPLFHVGALRVWNHKTNHVEPIFPQKLELKAALLSRVFHLLRFNAIDEAIQVIRDRYLAAGRAVVVPPRELESDGPVVAAALLIPMFDRDVANGIERWLQPARK